MLPFFRALFKNEANLSRTEKEKMLRECFQMVLPPSHDLHKKINFSLDVRKSSIPNSDNGDALHINYYILLKCMQRCVYKWKCD